MERIGPIQTQIESRRDSFRSVTIRGTHQEEEWAVEIKINKQSEVPVRDQLSAQLVFLIATGKLKAGEPLPSVRALARKLRIHHNTVSGAYQDLTGKDLLTRRRGSRMVVRFPDLPLGAPTVKDLDDLINDTLRLARRHGFTVRQ